MALWQPSEISPVWWFDGTASEGYFSSGLWADRTGNYHISSSSGLFNNWSGFEGGDRYPASIEAGNIYYTLTSSVENPSSYTFFVLIYKSEYTQSGFVTQTSSASIPSMLTGDFYRSGSYVYTYHTVPNYQSVIKSNSNYLTTGTKEAAIIVQRFSAGESRETLRINGSQISTTDEVTNYVPHVSGTITKRLGTGGGCFVCYMYFNRALTQSEIEKVEGYLYHHFSEDTVLNQFLSLSATHPYKTDAPVASIYADGVFDSYVDDVIAVGESTVNSGYFESPEDAVDAVGVIPVLADGDFESVVDDVFANAVVVVVADGDFEQLVDEYTIDGSVYVYGGGYFDGQVDEIDIAGYRWAYGEIVQPVDDIAGEGLIGISGAGSFYCWLDRVDSEGSVAIDGNGLFVGALDEFQAIGAGVIGGVGDFDQFDDIYAVGAVPVIIYADAAFGGLCDEVDSGGIIFCVAAGSFDGQADEIYATGSPYCYGSGEFVQYLDDVNGSFLSYTESGILEFIRDYSGIIPVTGAGVFSSLIFSRCSSDLQHVSNPQSFQPLSYSRCN